MASLPSSLDRDWIGQSPTLSYVKAITMNRTSVLLAIGFTSLFSTTILGEEHKYLKAFPPAAESMERYVIELPHKERGEDGRFKVEIMVGKEMSTDGVNNVRLSATIEAKPLKGWGFTYYEVAKFGPTASTLMAVPPGTKPQIKFLSTSKTIPYNSRVPIVVYVPKDGEVRYRIWEASQTIRKGNKK